MVELPVHRNPSIGGMATDNKVASETSLQLLMLATKCENAMTGPFKFSVSLIILHLFSGVFDLIRTLVLVRTIHAQKFSPCNGNLTRSSSSRHRSSVRLVMEKLQGGERYMSRKTSRDNSRINRLRPLASLLAAGLSLPALAAAQSVPYPTYETGPQPNGSWVVSSGQVITPAGKQVNLGNQVRAKAIALNPNVRSHTAAVLTLGASEAVEVFDTRTHAAAALPSAASEAVEVFDPRTGAVLQDYITFGLDPSGRYGGIAYSADGKYLMFSQDSSNVTIAKVSEEGLLTDDAQVSVPPDNSFITCFPNSPPAAYATPCGTFWSPGTSYPGGITLSNDGKSAYVLLNQNDTLAKIDLTATPPTQGEQIRVGNAPHSIVIGSSNGKTAYVSNEGGRAATEADFQINSAGTEIVADPVVGAAITGTVSVVDLASMTVTATISTGLHPTGMAFYGRYLLVANTYSDTISVIDTATNKVAGTINLGLPIGVPGEGQPAYGA